MRFNKILVKNKATNKAISVFKWLKSFSLKVLLNDSIKLFYILSSKFLIIMRVDFSNLFFTSSLYEGNPSVTIDLGFPKCLACLKRENAHYAE